GATLLKDLLDTQYPNQNTLIVGDYNDVLEGTIATGVTPAVSSYDVLVRDSANYVSLTLPLARAGAQSTASYATVIDNAIATKSLANYYIKGTAAVRTDAAALITNYATTTSDHYPVFTRYSFASPDLVVSTANQIVAGGNYNSITVTGTGSGTLQDPVQRGGHCHYGQHRRHSSNGHALVLVGRQLRLQRHVGPGNGPRSTQPSARANDHQRQQPDFEPAPNGSSDANCS
nr:hypothetical protein [Tanacetum cinerariifolium]